MRSLSPSLVASAVSRLMWLVNTALLSPPKQNLDSSPISSCRKRGSPQASAWPAHRHSISDRLQPGLVCQPGRPGPHTCWAAVSKAEQKRVAHGEQKCLGSLLGSSSLNFLLPLPGVTYTHPPPCHPPPEQERQGLCVIEARHLSCLHVSPSHSPT